MQYLVPVHEGEIAHSAQARLPKQMRCKRRSPPQQETSAVRILLSPPKKQGHGWRGLSHLLSHQGVQLHSQLSCCIPDVSITMREAIARLQRRRGHASTMKAVAFARGYWYRQQVKVTLWDVHDLWCLVNCQQGKQQRSLPGDREPNRRMSCGWLFAGKRNILGSTAARCRR